MRRAAALYGISFTLMLVISAIAMVAKAPKAGINIPWLSVAISIFAVAVPAAVVCYWPKDGAPNALPPVYACGYNDQLECVDADGMVSVPDGPGLGVTYDWDFINANRQALHVFE